MSDKPESMGTAESILLEKDETIARLTSALESAQKQIAKLKRETLLKGVPEHLAADVEERIKSGLPLDTAIEAARNQFERDKKSDSAIKPKTENAKGR